MSKKREKEPKTGESETEKEKSLGEELSDSEKIDLIFELYTTNFLSEEENKEAYLGYFKEYPEAVSETIRVSELTPEQLRFLKRCMTEINRRAEIAALAGVIGSYFVEEPDAHYFSKRSNNETLLAGKLKDWANIKELERLLKESEEASTEFIIPGSDADRNGKLSFDLNKAKSWRNSFLPFDYIRRDKRDLESDGEKLSEKDTGRLSEAEKRFRTIDDDFKKLIEKFEREKASISTAPKEEIPEEESEEDLGKARNEAESAFEEGEEKE